MIRTGQPVTPDSEHGGKAMNGVHDLGGLHGFGPVVREPNEPVFHADWERKNFGLLEVLGCDGHFNIDEIRHGIERMGPDYLNTSYTSTGCSRSRSFASRRACSPARKLRASSIPTQTGT